MVDIEYFIQWRMNYGFSYGNIIKDLELNRFHAYIEFAQFKDHIRLDDKDPFFHLFYTKENSSLFPIGEQRGFIKLLDLNLIHGILGNNDSSYNDKSFTYLGLTENEWDRGVRSSIKLSLKTKYNHDGIILKQSDLRFSECEFKKSLLKL